MFSLYDTILSLKAYILLTLMFIIAIIGFLLQLLIYPIFYFNTKFYRFLTDKLLNIFIPAFLAPILINNFNIYMNKKMIDSKSFKTNNIYMCNHAGRIDWILSLWFGYNNYSKKVNFIAEVTGKYLPIIGWYRSLCEDIYVSRTFNKDQDLILNNINSYKKDNVLRDIFFSPEGVIADKNIYDISMIKDCNNFCKNNNFKKFEYVLTPRYKGLNCLIDNNNKYYALTVAYFKNNKLMNCKLNDITREVPDLITLLKYNLQVYIYGKEINKKALDNPEKIKKKLLNVYKQHDKYLKRIEKNKELYKGQKKNEPFIKFNNNIYKKMICFFSIFLIILLICYKFKIIKKLNKIITYLFLIISINHTIAENISGYSRESIPFETALKSFLYKERDKEKY